MVENDVVFKMLCFLRLPNDDGAWNEHAVKNPEEVAAMVDM